VLPLRAWRLVEFGYTNNRVAQPTAEISLYSVLGMFLPGAVVLS
jgi:hypothetical protein